MNGNEERLEDFVVQTELDEMACLVERTGPPGFRHPAASAGRLSRVSALGGCRVQGWNSPPDPEPLSSMATLRTMSPVAARWMARRRPLSVSFPRYSKFHNPPPWHTGASCPYLPNAPAGREGRRRNTPDEDFEACVPQSFNVPGRSALRPGRCPGARAPGDRACSARHARMSPRRSGHRDRADVPRLRARPRQRCPGLGGGRTSPRPSWRRRRDPLDRDETFPVGAHFGV